MFAELGRRLLMLVRRKEFDADLDEEMRLHRELREQEQIERGLSPKEAHYAAQRRFGNDLVLREESRDMWGWNWLENLFQDIRYGVRVLRKNPGFTLLVTGLLALGIGGTTVIFGLFDAVFLRPLPVRHPGELVRMVEHILKKGPPTSNFRFVYYEALQNHATTLAATFGETGAYFHFPMSDPQPAEEITVNGVTPNFFESLGVRPLYGRVLLPDDASERPGMPPAVLSYDFWQRRFGGDPSVVNRRTLLVNGHRFVIVGVTPRDFNGLTVETAPDIRVPLRAYCLMANTPKEQMDYELAGRLKRGVVLSQAQAECQVLWRSTMENYYRDIEKFPTKGIPGLLAHGMELEPLARGVSILRFRYGDVIKLLMACVALLLLIVCTNVAGLLLERAAAREQEITVRLAVGATRGRLIRQVLVENLVLAALGAAGGLGVAVGAMPLAIRALPPVRAYPSTVLVPLSLDVRINWRVFLFVLVLSLVTMLLFSVSPAFAISRSNLEARLRATRASAGVRGRQALIVLQIALCTSLLAVASLFVRTFRQLERVNPGFDTDHIATFTIELERKKDQAAVFLKTFAERVRAIPGVVSVGTSSVGVMRGAGVGMTVAPVGQRITPADFLNTSVNYVSPEYFETMGMHILDGRDFTPNDTPVPKRVGPIMVVVNGAFQQRFFPNVQPLGKLFGPGPPGQVGGVAGEEYEIIGVVNDSKYRSLRAPVVPTFYTPEINPEEFVLNVRTRMRPEAIIAPVRKTLASLDPSVPFLEIHTLAEEVDNSIAGERMTAALASLFGGIATLLVGVGIYGLLAYMVMQRQKEIGIRMALGAQRDDILKLVVGQGFILTLAGLGIGVLGSLAATRFLDEPPLWRKTYGPTDIYFCPAANDGVGAPCKLSARAPRHEGRSHGGAAV